MNSAPPAISVRDATASDLALISDIHLRSRVATYRGQVADHYLDVIAPATSLDTWRARLPELLAGAGRVLIAQVGGEPVGFVCALAVDAQGSVYVNNLHALPQHKGRGAGTALLRAVESWARASGARGMHLKVLETNRAAIGFYESRGWRCRERVADAWAAAPIVALVYAIELAGPRPGER